MKGPALPAEGGCRCGRVRLRITAPPLLAMACHCTGCQRMSASAFSLSAAIPKAGFAVTQGETVVGGLHGQAQHRFCAFCMSWMFTELPGLDFVNLRPTMLDAPGWFVPFVETYTSEKLPWAATPAMHSFEKFPRWMPIRALSPPMGPRWRRVSPPDLPRRRFSGTPAPSRFGHRHG